MILLLNLHRAFHAVPRSRTKQRCAKIEARGVVILARARRCGDRPGIRVLPKRRHLSRLKGLELHILTPHPFLVMFKTTTRLFKPNAIRNFTTTPSRPFHFSAANMGVTKQKLQDGDGKTYAKAGDNITMEYTGTLFDENAPNKKGKQYVCV